MTQNTDRQLTERQEHILRLLVRSYVETGIPVGSQTLVENFDLQVSSATVRNELAVLDDLGYLQQLHTSAGRIPTEKGYRYFVQRLIGEFELPLDERQMIRHQFHQTRLELDQWMRLAAAVLAHTSHGASIVTSPRPATVRFRHVQLISTQGRLVLMILVMVGGQVQQQMLTLAEPVTQARLSAVAAKLNSRYENAYFEDLHSGQYQHEDALERDVLKLVLDGMARVNRRGYSNVYRDGLANIIEDEGTRQAVRVLEEGTFLTNVLTETLAPDSRGVHVVIGGEGRWEELRDCTMILARYGAIGQLSGAVAVLGPTRMAYGRNISAVRFVAELMSGLVSDYYLDASSDSMMEDAPLDEVDN